MSKKFYLSAPLDIEGWEVFETLERFTLYDEFSDRIDDALELIREGQEHWAGHMKEGEWSAESVRVLSNVRRLSYNILEQFERSRDDLPRCIHWTVGESSNSPITDSQYIAALAIDRACRAIETLERWLSAFDKDLCAGNADDLNLLAQHSQADIADFLSHVRNEHARREIEARESAADLMGVARNYMTLANVYTHPLVSRSEKDRICASARKAGKHSASIRREATVNRNKSICAHAKRLLSDGRTKREIVGIILGTDSALKTSGSGSKLSQKQIRNILMASGILLKTD